MDPANLHSHHQLQEHEYAYGRYYSSLLFQPDYNSKVSSTNNMNSPGIILECWARPNSGASMCEGLKSSFCEQSAANEFLLSKMKEEMPDSMPKLSETIYNSENHLLMSNFSSIHHISELQLLATGEIYSNTNNFQNSTMESSSSGSSGRYNNSFSHILPSINISNSDLDLNLQVVDLLSSPKYDIGATYSKVSQNSSTSHDQYFMGEVKNSPSTSSSNKNSALGEAITQRKKRSSSFIEAKKHRPPSRSSCPQLKVRKEKLREKIATLQRLVAPYGKTDTASVLTEAIGYIQFLLDQVQTLSVPYMRSSNSNPTRTIEVSSSEEDGKGQSNTDLLSRGLCLVHHSSIVTMLEFEDST